MTLRSLSNALDLGPGPKPSALSYTSRLHRFWSKMEDNSVAIFLSSPKRLRSNDTYHEYRQASDIVYLNGFPEPGAALILTKFGGKQQFIMLVRPKDPERETWDGRRAGVEGAKRDYFAQAAYPISEFDTVVAKLVNQASRVYFSFGTNPTYDEKFRKIWEHSGKQLLNPNEILHEMRLFKSAEEVKILRHACDISSLAHISAMKAVQPGMMEYQLQAVVELVFALNGATAPAYGSIVAAGNNATVLHYVENNMPIQDGDLILIDAGAEYGSVNGGYAGDITRCFPANGKFSEAQRQIYELVLAANEAAIKAAVPGVPVAHVHQTAERVLRRGLIKLGILDSNATSHNSRRKKNRPALTLDDFFMHGTSHWLGIDVHDVGNELLSKDSRYKRSSRRRRGLQPGMVLTIEPGLYFRADDLRVPAQYRGIGVRIEDDVLITASGNEVLTARCPKTVQEIEDLMAEKA